MFNILVNKNSHVRYAIVNDLSTPLARLINKLTSQIFPLTQHNTNEFQK